MSRPQAIIIKINAICQEVRDMRLFTQNLSSHVQDNKPVALDNKNLSLQEYVENNIKGKAWRTKTPLLNKYNSEKEDKSEKHEKENKYSYRKTQSPKRRFSYNIYTPHDYARHPTQTLSCRVPLLPQSSQNSPPDPSDDVADITSPDRSSTFSSSGPADLSVASSPPSSSSLSDDTEMREGTVTKEEELLGPDDVGEERSYPTKLGANLMRIGLAGPPDLELGLIGEMGEGRELSLSE